MQGDHAILHHEGWRQTLGREGGHFHKPGRPDDDFLCQIYLHTILLYLMEISLSLLPSNGEILTVYLSLSLSPYLYYLYKAGNTR